MIAAFALLVGTIVPGGGTTVPIELERGVVFVRGQLNNAGPLLFVFDPGAPDFATTYAQKRLSSAAVTSIRLGNARVPTTMEVLPGNPNAIVPRHDPNRGTIAASVGPAVLRRYAVTIDYAESTMVLTPLKDFVPPAGATRLPLTFDSFGMPVIDAAYDGKPEKFELDVRAPQSMLFTPFVERVAPARYGRHELDSFSVAGTHLQGIATWFSNAGTGKFASSEVAGLLGNNVWSHFVVTLDFLHRAAYVAPQGSPPLR